GVVRERRNNAPVREHRVPLGHVQRRGTTGQCSIRADHAGFVTENRHTPTIPLNSPPTVASVTDHLFDPNPTDTRGVSGPSVFGGRADPGTSFALFPGRCLLAG